MHWGVQGNRSLAESSIATGYLELSTYMLSSKYTSPSLSRLSNPNTFYDETHSTFAVFTLASA